MARTWLTCGFALALLACGPSESDPAELWRAAVAAHGGAEALSRLDDLRVSSRVSFRGQMELERTLHFRAPDRFSMTIAHEGRAAMSFGLAGERCWEQHRMFVLPCRRGSVAGHRRIAEVLRARFLHGLDPAALAPAGTISDGGRELPAVRAGELRLGFDPESHLLVRIEYEEPDGLWVETYSDFVERAGARVARRRELAIAGELDVTETWNEIVPGGADPNALVPPETPELGSIFDGEDAARTVLVASVVALEPPREGEDRLASARRQLEALARSRGLRASGTDGLLVRFAEDGEEVALTLDAAPGASDGPAGPARIATWPGGRYVGVWVREQNARVSGPALDEAVRARGYEPQRGARSEFLLAPGAESRPPAERIGLLRLAVAR
ncbi:MAG TPA: hypothetical protein VIL20_17350 [Sandaracinaceae bacterium]